MTYVPATDDDLGDWLRRQQQVASAAAARGTPHLRALLLRLAQELRGLVPVDHPDPQRTWSPLGIRVVVAPLAHSGLAGTPRGIPTVLLASDDPPTRRRFTAAHEVAHLILGPGGGARSTTAPRADAIEEALCDAFAARLLAPPSRVAAVLDQAGRISDPRAVFVVARELGTTLTAAVVAMSAVAGHPALADIAVFLARRRPQGIDGPVAWRITAAAACAPLALHPGQRLTSVGLEWLDTELQRTAPPHPGAADALIAADIAAAVVHVQGEDVLVADARRVHTEPRTGHARGRVAWSAHRTGSPAAGHAVIVANLANVTYDWRGPRRASSVKPR